MKLINKSLILIYDEAPLTIYRIGDDKPRSTQDLIKAYNIETKGKKILSIKGFILLVDKFQVVTKWPDPKVHKVNWDLQKILLSVDDKFYILSHDEILDYPPMSEDYGIKVFDQCIKNAEKFYRKEREIAMSRTDEPELTMAEMKHTLTEGK